MTEEGFKLLADGGTVRKVMIRTADGASQWRHNGDREINLSALLVAEDTIENLKIDLMKNTLIIMRRVVSGERIFSL